MTAAPPAGAWSGLYDTFSALVRFQTDLWSQVDAAVRAAHGVPINHVTVLQVIAATDDCRVGDVVSTLHITVGGVSKNVDRLVAEGWAVRLTDPHDGRSSILETTPAGEELLRDAGPTIETVLEERLRDPLTPAALAALDDTLAVLRAPRPGGVPAEDAGGDR
jgi:DNA-binding MarR family transcriptional regulator